MRHKVVSCGEILASYVDDDQVCHEVLPLALQKTQYKQRVDVALCLEVPSSWNRSIVRRGPKIRKVVIGTSDVPVSRVADELSRFHNQKVVAVKMQLDRPKRQESWLNPEIVEKLVEIKATRNQLTILRNNGGKGVNFFSKTLRMLEADVTVDFGENAERLQIELDNFSRRFSLTW
jgi:hypothetical protein